MTQIPYIDQVYWEEINTFLSQMISSSTGGIHFWNRSNPKPVHLSSEHEGLTGWEVSSKTLQRWTGTEWFILSYGEDILKPLIYEYLLQNSQSPSWLVELIKNTFISWNPTVLPQWIIDAFDFLLVNLPLTSISDLLNIWEPIETSELYKLILSASTTGGLSAEDFILLFRTWDIKSNPLTWLNNYLNRVSKKFWSQFHPGDEVTYLQIENALNTWWYNTLKEDILDLLSFTTYKGQFSFLQIEQALDWWNQHSNTLLLNGNSLKEYIDKKDTATQTYNTNLFTSLEKIEDDNYKLLYDNIIGHTHGTSVIPITNFTGPITNFTGYAAWPYTEANNINTYNFPVIIGACVTDTLNHINISVFPFDFNQSVWGNYSAKVKIVILPSSKWSDKSGSNNSPNNITVSSLLSATSNIITINCPDTSQQFGTTTSFSDISEDNMYFVYLIWERVYWPDNYVNKPMTCIVGLFKSDGTKLQSTVTTGSSTIANMRYSTFYGHYSGPGESTP